jgi:transposase-like protein
MSSLASALHFHDEAAAFKFVEDRVWPRGAVCPHCGCFGRINSLKGKSTRLGVYKCYDCRKPFTVRVGTIFEDSHVKLHLWLQAIFLVAASKKGISANQLHRVLGVTLKTAWFMGHRIRLAMQENPLGLMGSDGGIVEIDETYIGRKPVRKIKAGPGHKEMVFALVERKGSASTSGQTSGNGSGRVRQVWGTFAVEGARPECAYLRAVRSLIPAFAAAVTWEIPCVNNDMSNLTCSSVTTQPPL